MRSLVAGAYLVILLIFLMFAVLGQSELSPEVARRSASFDAARAMDHAARIDALTRSTGGRMAGSKGNVLVRSYIEGEMARAGLAIQIESFGDMIGGELVNVVGVVPGQTNEAVLVCAHHDANGAGPAAVQGTAGLAVLLELARDAAESARAGSKPRRTLLFASWDGDAFGCAGSMHFVASLPEAQRKTLRAVVSLDAIGWKRGTAVLHTMRYHDRFGAASIAPDWLVTRVSNAARERGSSLPIGDRWLGLVDQVVVRVVDVGDYSDDRPFLARGVPAVFISNFSLMRSYPFSGTASDTIDQLGRRQVSNVGRAVEAALTDLTTAANLPAGEADYVVISPPFLASFSLTGDEARTLGMVCLLPGGLVLIRRRRDGGLLVTRALFFAFATIFIIGAMIDPILFPALFATALLAGPLLAVPDVRAVWGYLASFLPALLFTTLIIPVYVTGSAGLIRLTSLELAALAGLVTIGLIQAPLHYRRARRAKAAQAGWSFRPSGLASTSWNV